MWNMARNHTVRSSLVNAKIVPAVSDVWVRQALHCHNARFSSSQCAEPSTRRTLEARRPTPGEKRLAAFFFGTVEPLELHVRQASLKLHLVACHGAPP